MYDTVKAIQAQREYCEEHGRFVFAPEIGGQCYRCHRNIYAPIDHGGYTTGITVEEAGRTLITGCPHCHHSFVE